VSAVPDPADVARAIERTRLSWRRTSLTATGVLVIGVFRLLLPNPSAWTVAGVTLFAVAWLGMVTGAQRRISALSTPDPRRTGQRRAGRIPLVLALLVAAGAAASLLVLG
jgi:uncharacterized membrane protein YidH (DUF202 family)